MKYYMLLYEMFTHFIWKGGGKCYIMYKTSAVTLEENYQVQ